jgi:hypothetical protein
MKITVRAYSKDDYYKDILEMSDRQVWMSDVRVTNNPSTGIGGIISPQDFPEMVKFEVFVEQD